MERKSKKEELYVDVWLIHFAGQRELTHTVKKLYSHKNLFKKKEEPRVLSRISLGLHSTSGC